MKPRKTKKPRQKMIKKLDALCIEVIRLRDEFVCQKCHKRVEKTNAHCSHVIPRSKGNALRWDLLNLKLLCYHDHINWWHKNPVESGEWFKATFPVRWEYLQQELAKHHGLRQWRDDELENLYKELLEKKKELQDG